MNTAYIYKISFENSEKVYIGYSIHPEKRFKQHLQALRDGIHHSAKLQLEYTSVDLGTASLEILDECSREDAPILEKHWIRKYNSYFSGYNSTPGGEGFVSGEHCPSSRHKLDDYKAVLTFLAYTDMSSKEIAEELGVGIGIVLNISSQTNHLYLKELMPIEWELMVSRKRHHPNWRSYPQVKSPTGDIFTVDSARKFSKEHGLDQSDFSKLLNGKKKQCKGWTLHA